MTGSTEGGEKARQAGAGARSYFGSIYRRCPCPAKVKTCPHSYYIRIRTGDGEWKRAAGNDPRTARAKLAEMQLRIEREGVLGIRETGKVTFPGFWPTMERLFQARLTGAGLRNAQGQYDIIAAHFGKRPLSAITTADVRDFLAGLRKPVAEGGRDSAPATLNRYMATLSSTFRAAVERSYAKGNPCEGIKRQRETARPVAFLPVEAIARILAACPGPYRAIAALAFECGARRGELLRLERRDCDLGRKTILIRTSKAGEDRLVPLSARAVEVLRGALAIPRTAAEPRVFPEVDGDHLSRHFGEWAEAAGYPGLRFHDTRHTAASWLAAAGTPTATIAAILGHRTLTMTLRYSRHAPEDAGARAMEAMGRARGQVPQERGAEKSGTHWGTHAATGTDDAAPFVVGEDAASPEGGEVCAVVGSGGFEPPEALAIRFTV